ncbi:hypothetical protein [Nitrosomonas sp.]|uniref:hypothetical protein n=1 Tax=Nitrosomonas sp. TaxID=42353 RepID=UPI00262E794C|nr:hypothetical protein [Nitrosomonas sp.]MCW5602533.1 hypothetical protein [Nitrosomonas sp.]
MIQSNTVQASVFYLGGARPPSDLMTVFIDKRCTIEIRTICQQPLAADGPTNRHSLPGLCA